MICKIPGCACAGNDGNVFPRLRGLAIATCITACAWLMCRDACRGRYLPVSFEVGCGDNVPGIPGACTTRNVTYLVRGPCLKIKPYILIANLISIFNNFIVSNFNHCPVVWMFTSKSSLNKLENIQKRALRFVCNDFVSKYSELLEKCGSQGVKLMALSFMAIEVYKCVTIWIHNAWMKCLPWRNVHMI